MLSRPLPKRTVEVAQANPVFLCQPSAMVQVPKIKINRMPRACHPKRLVCAEIYDCVPLRTDCCENRGRDGNVYSRETAKNGYCCAFRLSR